MGGTQGTRYLDMKVQISVVVDALFVISLFVVLQIWSLQHSSLSRNLYFHFCIAKLGIRILYLLTFI